MLKIIKNTFFCQQVYSSQKQCLYTFFTPTEMHIQLVEAFQKDSEGGAFRHFGKSVDIFGETLATVAEFAIGSGDVGVGVVDIARQENTRMHLAPVGTHLLTILTACVEVGNLVSPKNIVHVFGQLGLQRGHNSELLADKNPGKQFVGTGKDHGLLLEVLDMGALGEELGHITHLVTSFFRQPVAGTGEDGGTHENRHIRELLDQLRHQAQILRAIVLGGHMNLQESDIDIAQIIIVSLGRVADEELALWIIILQPIFEGSTDEATSDNSNVDHCCCHLAGSAITFSIQTGRTESLLLPFRQLFISLEKSPNLQS